MKMPFTRNKGRITRSQSKRIVEDNNEETSANECNPLNQTNNEASSQNLNTIIEEDNEMPTLNMFGETQQMTSKLPAINVLPFSGKPETLDFFISQLRDLQKFFKWDDRFLLMMAKSRLVDKAQAYISQVSTTKTIESAEELFQLLTKFFKKKPIAALIAEVENIRLLPAETIQNFAHRLDLAVAKVYVDIPEAELNKIKFVKFLALIPPEFRIFILQHTSSNYEVAVEKAILAQECAISESILNEKAESSQINQLTQKINALTLSIQKNQNNSNNNDNSTADRQNENKDQVPELSRRQNVHYRRQTSYNNRGYFRSRGGINKFKNQESYRNSAPSFQNSRQNDRCQLCHNFGHSARFCKMYGFQPRQNSNNNRNHFYNRRNNGRRYNPN